MSNVNNGLQELPLPAYYRPPESGCVIVRRDDTGVLAYWTGKAEWAFSIDNADAIRFARPQDAHAVLENVIQNSEGYRLHQIQYPHDQLQVELHIWEGEPLKVPEPA